MEIRKRQYLPVKIKDLAMGDVFAVRSGLLYIRTYDGGVNLESGNEYRTEDFIGPLFRTRGAFVEE